MSEYLEIIYKDNPILPTKSINKLIYLNDDIFISGGRDSSIKIWSSYENSFNILGDLKGHSDWVNDLCLNNEKTLLFSCSNDSNINIWRLKGIEDMLSIDDSDKYMELYPINSLNEVNNDYITTIKYSDSTKCLFSGGLDGIICKYNVSYSNKSQVISNKDNIIYKTNNKSVYSIDIDSSGNLLCASIYDNYIRAIDLRSNSIIFDLTRHDKLIRKVSLSQNGNLLLSGSSDKTINLWDMRFPNKILKCWDHYAGSITDIVDFNGFNDYVSSDNTGNIYLTNIVSGSFTKIDSLDVSITSIAMNNKMNIICSTIDNSLYEFSFRRDNSRLKPRSQVENKHISIIKENEKKNNTVTNMSRVSFKDNEVMYYSILKDRVYILYENKKGDVVLFNILKMSIVFIFPNSSIKTIYDSYIEPYDKTICKSWFTIDLRLGYLLFKFSSDVFNSKGDFDINYYEKILNLSQNFKIRDNDFVRDVNKRLSCLISSSQKLLNTGYINMKGKSNILNRTSIGYKLINNIVQWYISVRKKGNSSQSQELRKDKSELKHFLEENFINFHKFQGNYGKLLSSNMLSTIKHENKSGKEDMFGKDELNLNEIESLSQNQLFDYSKIEMISHKKNSHSYILINQSQGSKNIVSINDYSNKILNYDLFPSFIKDNLPEESKIFNINYPNQTNKKGSKFDLIITNKYNHFVKQANSNQNSSSSDEIEAPYDVSIEKFKEWVIEKYIDKMDFIRKVQNEIKSVDSKLSKTIKENYKQNQKFIYNFLDFELKDEMIIKNSTILLGDVKRLFQKESFIINLKFCNVDILLERGII